MVRLTPLLLAVLAALLCDFCVGSCRAEEIPFRVVNGFIVLDGHLKGSSERLSLLLDSGASVSVLDYHTARRLGVPFGAAQTIRGVHSEARARALKNERLVANGVSLGKADLAADLNAAERLCGEQIDALVGSDFFRERIVQIDFETNVLRCTDYVPKVRRRAMLLPLRIRQGVVCAPVGVNGSTERWVRVDTGCNEPLHWVVPRREARTIREERLVGSVGFVSRAEDLALVSLTIGNRTFFDTEAVLHGRVLFPGEAGLLGTGLLARFQSVIIDWPGRRMILSGLE